VPQNVHPLSSFFCNSARTNGDSFFIPFQFNFNFHFMSCLPWHMVPAPDVQLACTILVPQYAPFFDLKGCRIDKRFHQQVVPSSQGQERVFSFSNLEVISICFWLSYFSISFILRQSALSGQTRFTPSHLILVGSLQAFGQLADYLFADSFFEALQVFSPRSPCRRCTGRD